MGDTCRWCGLPVRGRGRRYCPRPRTCRQDAYRARKRFVATIPARVALHQISQELQARTFALDELLAELLQQERAAPGAHCIAAADFRDLVRELVRCAVIADREAGATWEEIGGHLGLTADAARHRYGHVRLIWPLRPRPDDEEDDTAG